MYSNRFQTFNFAPKLIALCVTASVDVLKALITDSLGLTKGTIALERRKIKVAAVVLQKCRSSWPIETAQSIAPMGKQSSKIQNTTKREDPFSLLC